MRALDLFAGTGWGVACQRLGIEEMGVEIMPEAIATREANGMNTVYNDVWDGLDAPKLAYELLIASPPCQTFSMAGKGSGRQALDNVIEAITSGAYRNPAKLRQFGEDHDPRTALVLTPLAHVFRDMPMFVTFEQVPTVLPVWEACADVMRGWGYSVKVANLHAEQYGVPQTRKRAILVARRDGIEVQLPTPTHSKYYSTKPAKLDEGVLPWVSMAEALGWDLRPEIEVWKWKDAPATTIAGDPRITAREHHYHGEQSKTSLRLNLEEAALLQSYPTGRGLTNRPAPTITGGGTEAGGAEPIAKFHERYTHLDAWQGGVERLTTEEAAALQSYPTHFSGAGSSSTVQRPRSVHEPAHTITGAATAEFHGRPTIAAAHNSRAADGRRLKTTEAGVLQSYECPFIWCGTKTKQFLQIGNAVPPLLAQHVLEALTQAAEAALDEAA